MPGRLPLGSVKNVVPQLLRQASTAGCLLINPWPSTALFYMIFPSTQISLFGFGHLSLARGGRTDVLAICSRFRIVWLSPSVSMCMLALRKISLHLCKLQGFYLEPRNQVYRVENKSSQSSINKSPGPAALPTVSCFPTKSGSPFAAWCGTTQHPWLPLQPG